MTTTNTIILILLLLFLFLLHCMIQDIHQVFTQFTLYIIHNTYTDFIKLYILFLSFFVELLLLLLLSISFSFFQIWVEDYSTFLSTHVYPKSIIFGLFFGLLQYIFLNHVIHIHLLSIIMFLFFNTPSLSFLSLSLSTSHPLSFYLS